MSDRGFTERFSKIVDAFGGQNAFARKSGLSQSGIARLVAGGEPTLSTLKSIAKAANQSLLWLADGIGAEPGDADNWYVPVIDAAMGAGDAVDNVEADIIGTLSFSHSALLRLGTKPENMRALRTLGTSMEPTIDDGALVLIDIGRRSLADGLIYALRAPDGLRIKRVQRQMDGGVLLISDNRDMFQPERLTPHEVEHVRVLGRAIWTEKRL